MYHWQQSLVVLDTAYVGGGIGAQEVEELDGKEDTVDPESEPGDTGGVIELGAVDAAWLRLEILVTATSLDCEASVDIGLEGEAGDAGVIIELRTLVDISPLDCEGPANIEPDGDPRETEGTIELWTVEPAWPKLETLGIPAPLESDAPLNIELEGEPEDTGGTTELKPVDSEATLGPVLEKLVIPTSLNCEGPVTVLVPELSIAKGPLVAAD